MDDWSKVPLEVRDALRYLSAHFYPKRYMNRWKQIRQYSLLMVEKVKDYSPNQFKEELEHFEFFDKQFPDIHEVELPTSYITFFDELMEEFREGNLMKIVTRFHLVTEGILATMGLSLLKRTGEKYNLKEFSEGIKRIIEDEARHVAFGYKLVYDKEYAIKRINSLYPYAIQIVIDGKEKLSRLAPFEEILAEMEKLKEMRMKKL
ncbi:MAG: hypothetical protein QXZ61_05845, partial [Saccharolobus sp.]